MPSLPESFQRGSNGLPRDIDEAEEAFIRAHELERRMPGCGRWPFAGDAPWHLMQRRVSEGDYSGDGQDGVSDSRPPRPPLRTHEVDDHARTVGWLQLLPDELDRKIVWLATARLAAGEGRPPWSAMVGWLKAERGPDALARRYRRSLASIVCRLNGWPQRRVKAMAA